MFLITTLTFPKASGYVGEEIGKNGSPSDGYEPVRPRFESECVDSKRNQVTMFTSNVTKVNNKLPKKPRFCSV